MKVDRVRANHSLRLTASQGTPNIPFHWFQLLGSYRQAQKKRMKKTWRLEDPIKSSETNELDVGIRYSLKEISIATREHLYSLSNFYFNLIKEKEHQIIK